MRYFLVAVAFIAIALLQSSVIPRLSPTYAQPNLVLVAIICWGTMRGIREAVIWGALGGVLLDILSGMPPGVNLIALVPVSLATGVNEIKILENSLLLSLAIVFVGTFIYGASFLLILQGIGNQVYWGESMVRNLIPSAFLNALLTPLIYWFFLPFDRWAKK